MKFNFKKHPFAGLAIAAALVAMPLSALAANVQLPIGWHPVVVAINDRGNVNVHGARVTSVSGDILTAVTSWGSSSITWTVKTNASTKFSGGENASLAAVKTGDFVSFSGSLESSGFTVMARVLHDLSALPLLKSAFSGSIGSVSTSSDSFTLATKKAGTITVDTSASTSIKSGGTILALPDLLAGEHATAKGTFDASTSVLSADSVRIHLLGR